MDIPNYYIEPATYTVDFDDVRYVRMAVFVFEQQIAPEEEFDELDQQCHHVIARDEQGQPIGTGRLTAEGQIGRLAVLKEWRGQGIGRSLVCVLLEKAQNLGLSMVKVNAQKQALSFYRQFGFDPEGEVFMEAGIPHQTMRLTLEAAEPSDRPSPKPRDSSVQAAHIDTIESTLAATLQLINDARRELYIYSQELEYSLYAQNDLVDALKRFVLRNRNIEVKIIIQEPAKLRGKVHPVLELAQRLSSHFLIRTPVEEQDKQYSSAFILNDRDGYLFRLVGERFEGHWSPNLPARKRQLQEEFERVWQRAQPCTEFRALGL